MERLLYPHRDHRDCLLIAISLEQMVEFFHHREQRHQLLEDLRQEAAERVRILPNNNRYHASLEKWFRDILEAAPKASPDGSFVTFLIPPKLGTPHSQKPETAVWSAAKASGAVSVLSRSEIEAWERVAYLSELAQKQAESSQAAARALRATCDHLGISLAAGASIHITLEQRNELTRDLGTLLEAGRSLIDYDVDSLGASNGILHGAQTWEQLEPYIDEAIKSMPL